MFGQDFHRIGSASHIQSRIGDGDGDPFNGQIKLLFMGKEVLVLSPSSINTTLPSISFTNAASGKIERVYLSLDESAKFQEDEKNDFKNYFSMKIIKPTGFCLLPGDNKTTLVITDSDHTVKFISLSENAICNSYGQFGAGPGEFCDPVAIGTFKVDLYRSIFCVLERGGNQRIQFFDENMNHLLLYGGMGHSRGRFFDPTSISCFSSLNLHKRKDHPDFYKGICSLDDLVFIFVIVSDNYFKLFCLKPI